jgi:hypothetical protein
LISRRGDNVIISRIFERSYFRLIARITTSGFLTAVCFLKAFYFCDQSFSAKFPNGIYDQLSAALKIDNKKIQKCAVEFCRLKTNRDVYPNIFATKMISDIIVILDVNPVHSHVIGLMLLIFYFLKYFSSYIFEKFQLLVQLL